MPEELTLALSRLTAAAEAIESALAAITSQYETLNSKIDRIVAAIDEPQATRLPAAAAAVLSASGQRKTLPPLVSALLSKNNVDDAVASTPPRSTAHLALSHPTSAWR